jgi:hypothetical protein
MVITSSGLRRRLLIAACTLLLLFAQHTALAHALWHALGTTPAQHAHSEDTPKPSGGSLCNFDAVIGEVLGGAAPVSVCVLHADASEVARAAPGLHVVLAARFLAPLSRGPPALS